MNFWNVKMYFWKDFKLFRMFSLKIIGFRQFWIFWYAYRKIIKETPYSLWVSATIRCFFYAFSNKLDRQKQKEPILWKLLYIIQECKLFICQFLVKIKLSISFDIIMYARENAANATAAFLTVVIVMIHFLT